MSRHLMILLSTTPYSFENTYTAFKLAEAALDQEHRVTLFASGDGIHNFTVNQNPKGILNPEEKFGQLIERGMRVDLCGTCLQFRGIKTEHRVEGAEPSSLKNLFALMDKSDVFINLGF
ncbi:MAG: DsrE family protein [Desulfitobacteriaceae bacterium]